MGKVAKINPSSDKQLERRVQFIRERLMGTPKTESDEFIAVPMAKTLK